MHKGDDPINLCTVVSNLTADIQRDSIKLHISHPSPTALSRYLYIYSSVIIEYEQNALVYKIIMKLHDDLRNDSS